MNGTADSPNQLDPERLRSVAANFSGLEGFNLRGLTSVVFGATFAAIQMAEVYWRGSHWIGLVLLACGGFFIASLIYAPKYYRWRFGWIQSRPALVPNWLSNMRLTQIIVVVACIFLLWVLVDLAEHALPVRIDLMPLIAWFAAFCVALWLRSKDRRRLQYVALAFLVMMVVAYVTFYPLWHSLDARQLLFWKTLNAGSLGFGFIVVGLYDHLTLVRMIPKRIAEDDHDDE